MNGYGSLLDAVNKPQRYIGGEWNSVRDCVKKNPVKVLLSYPDLYEVAMSNMALRIFYEQINEMPNATAERVFSPAPDLTELLKEKNLPLISLESGTPVKDFDLLAVTLQYELTYTNMLTILDLGGVPIHSAKRTEEHPFVIIGGPCATNPLPLFPFVDLVFIGDGELVFPELVEVLAETRGRPREERLAALARLEGVFSPQIEKKVKRRIAPDLDALAHPLRPIVPFMPTVHDRVSMEIARGCPHGCRFCHAGFTYRPYRERSVENLVEIAAAQVASTGYNEVSLASLSATDYTRMGELVEALNRRFKGKGVSLALPSLRISDFSVELAQMVGMVRRGGLTFAPEAGSQQMRDRINKGVNEEDLMNSVIASSRAGWKRVKLYFMAGLPGETDEDILAIADLAVKAQKLGKKIGKGGFKVTASVSSFVPKSHTPFQWEARIDKETYLHRMRLLKNAIGSGNVQLKYSHTMTSELEAVFSRGDEETAILLESAWRHGASFDGWEEFHNQEAWETAFAETGIDRQKYFSAYDNTQPMPWDFIDMVVEADYLRKELSRSACGLATPMCDTAKCRSCGVC